MIKIKPEKTDKPLPGKIGNDRQRQAESQSTRQIAKNAVHGGPKDPKKDKRMGVGRGQKG
jgi:hypothetical protein